MTPSGTGSTFYNFCSLANCPDGWHPVTGLLQTTNRDFYGTTGSSGTSAGPSTIFKITTSGTLTTLYTFCPGSCPSGGPSTLIEATDGNFYGTTDGGPAVFKMTPSGKLTTLYTLSPTDQIPSALIQAIDGDFYGTTFYGGTNTCPNQFQDNIGCGTIFKITSSGVFTTLHSFDFSDGAWPEGPLIQATDGNFYGTTTGGGYGWGTVFRLTPTGTLTTLHIFCSQGCLDGQIPYAGLVQATNGDLYGTARDGGAGPCYILGQGCGTVFSLSVGLGPFVKMLPSAAPAGEVIRILGTDLTGATSVTFNGTASGFSVASPTQILAKVPAGATTGDIQATLPGGTLSSKVDFDVLRRPAE